MTFEGLCRLVYFFSQTLGQVVCLFCPKVIPELLSTFCTLVLSKKEFQDSLNTAQISLQKRLNFNFNLYCSESNSGVNFTNIFASAFTYRSVSRSFSAITVLICNYLAKGNFAKGAIQIMRDTSLTYFRPPPHVSFGDTVETPFNVTF